MVDVKKLLNEMSLKEKIGQLNLVSYKEEIIDAVKKGEVGAVLNVRYPESIKKLQEAALASPRGYRYLSVMM